MKKFVSLLIIGILITVFYFPTSTVANEAIVHTDNLNVRSGPGTDYEKIQQVNTNEVYTILNEENDWVEIDLGDGTGWITTEYITMTDEIDSEKVMNDSDMSSDNNNENDIDSNENDSNMNDVVMTEDNTQVRNEPSTDGDIIYFATKGESFTVLSEVDDWYEIENNKTKGFVHQRLICDKDEIKEGGLHNKTIVLDAGHGGRDVGAIGISGMYEKSFTYQTTMELKEELKWLGANVVLTRDADEFISLGGRTSLANSIDTDAFISIHYNSTPDLPQVNGIGTYYYHDQHKELANAVQTGVIQTTEANDRGVAFENFHVTRQTFHPSILIELGFLSNQEEENLLKRSPYQKKIVAGILYGLQRYFGE